MSLPGRDMTGAGPVSLEAARARRTLQAYCRQRTDIAGVGEPWVLQSDADGYLGVRVGRVEILRLEPLPHGGWRLQVPLSDGIWQPWGPRPTAESIEAVLEELEQMPLHVHW